MGSTIGLAFPLVISFFILIFQAPSTSKGHLADEQLMTIPSRICHLLMHEYILLRGAYYIPDGHIAQFPVLCDYIHHG
jgi:hypothetical protein